MASASPHPADRHDLIRVQGARANNQKDVSVETSTLTGKHLAMFVAV